MNTTSISHIYQQPAAAQSNSLVRLILMQHESVSVRIHVGHELVRIVSGCAWISHEGKDIVLKAGEQQSLHQGRFNTLVATLGSKPLVFELIPTA